jgi:hypothetical protein
MNNLNPLVDRQVTNLHGLPQPSVEERLENLARELMTVASMLRSAELRGDLCPAETIERAKRALQAGIGAHSAIQSACKPATVGEVCERIAALIQSIPQGDPADGYSAALTMDVGGLQPSRGALEIACRRLRTTAMFRPKIPEVLAAVREAGIMYAAALRATDELPRRISRAERGGGHD